MATLQPHHRRPPHKRYKRYEPHKRNKAALLTALLVAAGLVSSCSGGGPSKIRMGTVGRADVAEVVQAAATVSARATATLRAPAEGTIKRLYVADGDTVHEGQVLAILDSPTARDQLSQAQQADQNAVAPQTVPAGLSLAGFQAQTDKSARSGFQAARQAAAKIPDLRIRAAVLTEIAKAEGVYRSAATAAQNAVAALNQGLGSVTTALASISSAQRVQTQAAVRTAQRVVDGLVLRAPFDGVASLGGPAGPGGNIAAQIPQGVPGLQGLAGSAGQAREAGSVAQGAPVSTGDAVVTVTDVSQLALSADVDENDVLLVQRGEEASVQLDALQNATYAAKVTGIGVTPKSSTGGGVTYTVTLLLEQGTNADGTTAPSPKPGMSATVGLKVRDAHHVLSVPSSAIVTSGKDSTVWVRGPGGRAVRRSVQVGAQGDANVQILSGLTEGQRIVVKGADAVRPGQDLP